MPIYLDPKADPVFKRILAQAITHGATSIVEALKFIKQGLDDEGIAQEKSLELALVQSLR